MEYFFRKISLTTATTGDNTTVNINLFHNSNRKRNAKIDRLLNLKRGIANSQHEGICAGSLYVRGLYYYAVAKQAVVKSSRFTLKCRNDTDLFSNKGSFCVSKRHSSLACLAEFGRTLREARHFLSLLRVAIV